MSEKLREFRGGFTERVERLHRRAKPHAELSADVAVPEPLVRQNHGAEIVPVTDDAAQGLVHRAHRRLRVPLLPGQPSSSRAALSASGARLVIEEASLDAHLRVRLWGVGYAGQNHRSASLIREVDALADFSATDGEKRGSVSSGGAGRVERLVEFRERARELHLVPRLHDGEFRGADSFPDGGVAMLLPRGDARSHHAVRREKNQQTVRDDAREVHDDVPELRLVLLRVAEPVAAVELLPRGSDGDDPTPHLVRTYDVRVLQSHGERESKLAGEGRHRRERARSEHDAPNPLPAQRGHDHPRAETPKTQRGPGGHSRTPRAPVRDSLRVPRSIAASGLVRSDAKPERREMALPPHPKRLLQRVRHFAESKRRRARARFPPHRRRLPREQRHRVGHHLHEHPDGVFRALALDDAKLGEHVEKRLARSNQFVGPLPVRSSAASSRERLRNLILQRQENPAKLLVLHRPTLRFGVGVAARRARVPVDPETLAPAPESVVLVPSPRVEPQFFLLLSPRQTLLLRRRELERLLRLANRPREVRRGQVERRRVRAHALDVMRLVEEKHRALPRDVRRLAQFRVDEVIVRHEYDVRAARHVAGEVIRTRAAPAADFSPLPDVDQILDVHGVRLAEIGIRLDETIHLVVMRTRARVRLGLTRRVLRHPRERGNVLMHAHLLARTDDRHARTVPRGAKFANHLGQLTVRARRVDDDGAAAGGTAAAARFRAIGRDGHLALTRRFHRGGAAWAAVGGVEGGVRGGAPGRARAASRRWRAFEGDGTIASGDRLAPAQRGAQQAEGLTRTYEV